MNEQTLRSIIMTTKIIKELFIIFKPLIWSIIMRLIMLIMSLILIFLLTRGITRILREMISIGLSEIKWAIFGYNSTENQQEEILNPVRKSGLNGVKYFLITDESIINMLAQDKQLNRFIAHEFETAECLMQRMKNSEENFIIRSENQIDPLYNRASFYIDYNLSSHKKLEVDAETGAQRWLLKPKNIVDVKNYIKTHIGSTSLAPMKDKTRVRQIAIEQANANHNEPENKKQIQ